MRGGLRAVKVGGKARALSTPTPTPTPTPGVSIGGVTIGTVGSESYNTGYTLMDGTDFRETLAEMLMSPANPFGKIGAGMGGYPIASTTRSPRNALGMYDADPFHTGYKNSNRDVAVPSFADIITKPGSTGILLKMRDRLDSEKAHMLDPNKLAIGSMIHMGARLLAMAPCIIESEVIVTPNSDIHQTAHWSMQTPYRTYNDLEMDSAEQSGLSTGGENINFWRNGTNTNLAGGGHAVPAGTPIRYAHVVDENGYVSFWENVNGGGWVNRRNFPSPAYETSNPTDAAQAKAQALAASRYSLHTNHVLADGWTLGSPAALMQVNWVRAWSKNGAAYKPLVPNRSYRVDKGATQTFALDTKAAVWGASTGTTDKIAGMHVEYDEPGGGTQFGSWEDVPSGITYDLTASPPTMTVDATNLAPGRLHIFRRIEGPGTICEPHHFVVEVGPSLASMPTTINLPAGTSGTYDLMPFFDRGVLVGGLSAFSVTGLPSGATFANGVITYSNVTAGSYQLAITVVNSVGQTTGAVTRTVQFNAPVTRSYAGWSGVHLFDADTATVASGTNDVVTLPNSQSGGGDFIKVGTNGSLKKIPAAQNGKAALRLVRSLTSAAQVPRMEAPDTSMLAQVFSGDDKAYIALWAYMPTDALTGTIWSASRSIDTSSTSRVSYTRRSGSVSGMLRGALDQVASAATGDVQGKAVVKAVKFTGTTISIWDNSLTPIVVDASHNTAALSDTLIPRLFATAGNLSSGSQTISVASQSSCDFYEFVVLPGSGKTDAEIRQAITDMAAYRGITLS